MLGLTTTELIKVKATDLALHVGSGTLEVFGTPAMIAYMEGVAMRLVQPKLSKGQGTVGIYIQAKHLKASVIGASLTVKATVTNVEDKKINFALEVWDDHGKQVGEAYHERFIIDEERFMQKIKGS